MLNNTKLYNILSLHNATVKLYHPIYIYTYATIIIHKLHPHFPFTFLPHFPHFIFPQDIILKTVDNLIPKRPVPAPLLHNKIIHKLNIRNPDNPSPPCHNPKHVPYLIYASLKRKFYRLSPWLQMCVGMGVLSSQLHDVYFRSAQHKLKEAAALSVFRKDHYFNSQNYH